MEKTIYLIRHGETNYNKREVIQGRGINADLNETGKQQARYFYSRYGHIQFDKVYTSGLIRTWQTVQHFTDKGIPWEKHSELDEMAFGEFEGKSIYINGKPALADIIQGWKSGEYTMKTEGGESPVDVYSRQTKFLKHIMSREDEKTILICMHGRAMRIFLCLLTGRELKMMENLQSYNTGLFILRYNTALEKFNTLAENDCSHLKPMVMYES